jgi:hypothetical protein
MSSILILTSNPDQTSRLRLDKEHRAVDDAKARFGTNADAVVRMHAATLEDITRALTKQPYDIVQFSGHGSLEGIMLEDSNLVGPFVLSADRLCAILLEAQPNLRAVLLTCCYSSTGIAHLAAAAPYLITVSGEGADEAIIGFVRVFYETFFQHTSVERAFHMAQVFVSAEAHLNTVLSRRAESTHSGAPLYQVFPSSPEARGDSILIDLSQVEEDIQRLDISRDRFLSILSRKIRIHRWIFSEPHDRAVLSIGHLFGVFSWQNANDVVRCERILRLKESVDERTCEAWTSLTIAYNEKCMARYRLSAHPASPENARSVESAVEDFYRTYRFYFEGKGHAAILRQCLPQQFKICRSLIAANLQHADLKCYEGDHGSAVAYIEMALSSLHDFLDSLTAELTE